MKRRLDLRLVLTAGMLLLPVACGSVAARPAPPTSATPATIGLGAHTVVGLMTPAPTPAATRSPTTRIATQTAVAPPAGTAAPAEAASNAVMPVPSPDAASEPAATPVPASPACGAVWRLQIPSIGVNAGFVPLGLLPGTRQMDSPKNNDDVGCYALDGYDGSNLVLGGHVDWYTGQPAVFGNLRRLQAGDEVQLLLYDGSLVRYRVTSARVYDATTPDVAEIVANMPVPTVTLITCDGEFNPVTDLYDKSRVVRAEKVDQ